MFEIAIGFDFRYDECLFRVLDLQLTAPTGACFWRIGWAGSLSKPRFRSIDNDCTLPETFPKPTFMALNLGNPDTLPFWIALDVDLLADPDDICKSRVEGAIESYLAWDQWKQGVSAESGI